MKYLMLVSLVHLIQGNIFEEGKCPTVEPVKNFDAKKVTGIWYIIEHYPNDYDSHYKCIKEDFSLADNGDILIYYTGINKKNNKFADGNATLMNVGDRNVASFLLRSAKTIPKIADIPSVILDTDYENYLIVWACYEKDNLSTRIAWIFFSTPTPNKELLEKAKAPFVEDHLNPEYMEVVDHETCNY